MSIQMIHAMNMRLLTGLLLMLLPMKKLNLCEWHRCNTSVSMLIK